VSHTIEISDALYASLEEEMRRRGLSSVEALIAAWQAENDLHARQAAVERIDALRERLAATYGEMPDSAELTREDRLR
jgi:hypothetical protein